MNSISDFCLEGKFLPVMCEDIPEEFRLKAKRDLHETPKKVEEGLKVLRKCIEREELNLRSDENILLMYLRQAKFDFKKAETRLRDSLKFYTATEELVQSCNIERIRAVVENNFVGMLPFRDAEGRTLLFARGDQWKKELFDMNDAVAAIGCLCLFTYKNPLTSICGISYIADTKVESLRDLFPISKAYLTYVPYLNVCPFRVQRVDALNTNILVRHLWSFIRPLAPSKIKKRVFLYGGELENLKKVYPESILPSEFGGTLEPINCNSYKEKFFEFVKNIKSEFRPNSK